MFGLNVLKWEKWILLILFLILIVVDVVVKKEVGIFKWVFELKIIFAGFIKNKLVLFFVIWIILLIWEIFFFLICVKIFWVFGVEIKLMVCLVFKLNCLKLWNKLVWFVDGFFFLILKVCEFGVWDLGIIIVFVLLEVGMIWVIVIDGKIKIVILFRVRIFDLFILL